MEKKENRKEKKSNLLLSLPLYRTPCSITLPPAPPPPPPPAPAPRTSSHPPARPRGCLFPARYAPPLKHNKVSHYAAHVDNKTAERGTYSLCPDTGQDAASAASPPGSPPPQLSCASRWYRTAAATHAAPSTRSPSAPRTPPARCSLSARLPRGRLWR